MAKKKVIAHFMHEYEENEIRDKIDKPSSTNSYHIGEMDEDDISSLRDKGIIIEVQDEEPIVITPGIQSRITQSRMRAKQISEPTRGIPSPSFGLSITAPEAALGPQGPEVDNEKPNFYRC